MEFERNLISTPSSCRTQQIFKYIQKLTGHKSLPTIVTYESSYATQDTLKASLFNSYFQSVYTQSSFRCPSDLPLPEHCIECIAISEMDVYEALMSLDIHKVMGVDGIGPQIVLFHCDLQTAPPLIFVKHITTENSSHYSCFQIR